MTESYRGSVQIGEGVQTEVVVTDLDSSTWSIDFPAHSWVPETENVRRHLVLKVELRDGPRAGQTSWGDLVIDQSDDSARMTGQSPFNIEAHGPS